MYELPTTLLVNNKEYKIRNNADYRVILDVIATCEDADLTPEEKGVIALIIFYEDINSMDEAIHTFGEYTEEAIDGMMKFISCSEDLGRKVNHKLIDWVQDEQLIVSAINKVAGCEIRAVSYMHWWTFLAHYMSVGECSLSTIVGIRDKISRGKKLEKYELDFKRENPQYFTWKNSLKETQNILDKIWNK